MRANELQIGDYVIRKNVPQEILIVDAIDSIRGIVYLDLDGLGITEKLENISPIEITRDNLVKMGFKKSLDPWFELFPIEQSERWDSEDKRVEIHGEYHTNTNNKWVIHVDNEDMDSIGSCEVTYIHEMQQFFRLCKYEYNFKIGVKF